MNSLESKMNVGLDRGKGLLSVVYMLSSIMLFTSASVSVMASVPSSQRPPSMSLDVGNKSLNRQGENTSITANRCDLVYFDGQNAYHMDIAKIVNITKKPSKIIGISTSDGIQFNIQFPEPKTLSRLVDKIQGKSDIDAWIESLIINIPRCRDYRARWQYSLRYSHPSTYVSPNHCYVSPELKYRTSLKLAEMEARTKLRGQGFHPSLVSAITPIISELPAVEGSFPLRGTIPSESPVTGYMLNGENSFWKRLELIRKAKHKVYLQTYKFFADPSNWILVRELIFAKLRGVDVQVYLNDQPPLTTPNATKDIFKMYAFMMSYGIPVHGYHKNVPTQLKDGLRASKELTGKRLKGLFNNVHDKILVVDDEDTILGGINMFKPEFRIAPEGKKDHHWDDYDIFLSSKEIASDAAKVFLQNINFYRAFRGDSIELIRRSPVKYGISSEDKAFMDSQIEGLDTKISRGPLPELHSFSSAQIFRSRPVWGETDIDQEYHQIINSSQKEIWILNSFFAPSESLLKALEAAIQRGVNVNIMTVGTELPLFNTVTARTARPFYFNLMAQNAAVTAPGVRAPGKVRVFEFNGKPDQGFRERDLLHAKLLFVDDETALVGSFNLDGISRHQNGEVAVRVRGAGSFISDFKAKYLPQELRLSREFTLKQAIEEQHGLKRSLLGESLEKYIDKF